MKKLIGIVAALTVAASAFAVDFSLGFRGNVNFGLGSSIADADTKKATEDALSVAKAFGYDTYNGGGVYFGGGLYGNIGLVDSAVKFGIQPELLLNMNGYLVHTSGTFLGESVSTKTESGTLTLDIPVIFALDLPLGDSFSLGFGLGPQLSIPLLYGSNTELNGEYVTDNLDYDVKNANFGLAFDVNAKLRPGEAKKAALVFDLRYNLDFTPTKVDVIYKDKSSGSETTITTDFETFYRRSLNVGLGVEVKF